MRYGGWKIQCSDCGKSCWTNKVGNTKCQGCRGTIKKTCVGCQKKFHSTTGANKCRFCKRVSGELTKKTYRRDLENQCSDIKKYDSDIRCLCVKIKHNLMTPADFYRVCDIYMQVTCNENKYSTFEAKDQVAYMLKELWDTLKMSKEVVFKTREDKRKKKVALFNEDGVEVKRWSSIRDCSYELDLNLDNIRAICTGRLKSTYLLRYA